MVEWGAEKIKAFGAGEVETGYIYVCVCGGGGGGVCVCVCWNSMLVGC